MAPRTVALEKEQTTIHSQITSLRETAETIQGDALAQALSRYNGSMQKAGLEELLQRHDFVDYFKFGLAECVAETAAAHDEHVQAIYYFDPNLNPDAMTEEYLPLDISVNLLLLVDSKTAALESFLGALDRALVRELPSHMPVNLNSIINPILFTEEDIAHGHGYAMLLSSLFNKPRQVWSRIK